MPNSPITSHFNVDPFSVSKAEDNQLPIYKIHLYEFIKRGAIPKYKILCSDKNKLIKYANDVKNQFKLSTINDGVVERYIYNYEDNPYEDPILINIKTGEIEDLIVTI